MCSAHDSIWCHRTRKRPQDDGDPGEQRKASKAQAAHEAVNTFEAVARDWHQHQAARWDAETARRILASLDADIFPTLGPLAPRFFVGLFLLGLVGVALWWLRLVVELLLGER